MSGPKRKRDVQVNFRVSPEELALIEQKMSQVGTKNREAYLRKMALDGYVVQLDLPELKELVSLLRRSSNNLNQLTRRVHETGRVYDADLEDIAQRQEQLWAGVKEVGMQEMGQKSRQSVDIARNMDFRDFLGGPVAKTRRPQCRGAGFDPWPGN